MLSGINSVQTLWTILPQSDAEYNSGAKRMITTLNRITILKKVARVMNMNDLPYSVLKDYSLMCGYPDPFRLPEDDLQAFIRLHDKTLSISYKETQ